MSGELVSLRNKVTTVRDLFLQNKEQIQAALPKHLTVDRMIRVAFTCINTTPKLLECTPRSLLAAVIQCAQLGLEPGVIGHVYLIPFKEQVQVIPGYKGLIALARNSAQISTIYAQTVYAEDVFHYQFGTDPKIEHIPSDTERGETTFYYAVCRMKDGGVQFEVMRKDDVVTHRDKYSKAARQGPWVTEFDEMAKKTVLRKLCKMLPTSIELQTAVVLDEQAEVQLPQSLPDVLSDGTPEFEQKPALSDLTKTLDRQSVQE